MHGRYWLSFMLLSSGGVWPYFRGDMLSVRILTFRDTVDAALSRSSSDGGDLEQQLDSGGARHANLLIVMFASKVTHQAALCLLK